MCKCGDCKSRFTLGPPLGGGGEGGGLRKQTKTPGSCYATEWPAYSSKTDHFCTFLVVSGEQATTIFASFHTVPKYLILYPYKPVLRIRMFLGLLDPDPDVFGPPGSGSGYISTKYGSGSGSFNNQEKLVWKTLIPTVLWLFLWHFIFEKSCKCSFKSNKQKLRKKTIFSYHPEGHWRN